MFKNSLGVLFLFLLFLGCSKNKDQQKKFIHLNPTVTGITFANQITENDSINVVNFQYCYNGGGVGIGDFDQNGLPDIVFSGNQVSSRIYLNQGGLTFTDVSEDANFQTASWVTGVSIVDINADGLDDIYLNVGGADCRNDCNNLLFINQGVGDNGVPTFAEQAKAYGLDDGHYSQQAVFFDFDYDGDLDVYIAHNGNSNIDKNNPFPKQYLPPHLKDFLLRNDTKSDIPHPVFTNISDSVGIIHSGFGLGLGINDFNADGLTDIYVANDFITEDLLYIQQVHPDSAMPFFLEKSKEFLGHETYNSMGMDFNDLNNDSRPDILVVDMLPKDYERHKKMLGMMNYEKYLLSLKNEYSAQYVRNTLQMNNGQLMGKPIKSSEIGFLKGIASTDWSWAPLMLDLDNDSDKDLYISNGYVKDVADLDYINYSGLNNMFGTTEERIAKQIEFANNLDSIYLPNFIYENKGSEGFSDVSTHWIAEKPSYSNGVAYADLDLDGDLDLVINNINAAAYVLENKTSDDSSTHFFRLRLKGNPKNPHGIGSQITLWNQGQAQYQFQSVIRGYLSSVEPVLHFGVRDTLVDSLQVVWPNGRAQMIRNLKADQTLTLSIQSAEANPVRNRENDLLFKINEGLLEHTHTENSFNEFDRQRLLMRQYSQQGPCIAVGNLDGEPGDELFIGGSHGQSGTIWSQDELGQYQVIQELDAQYEDSDASFVDIDGDGDLDLYIASGGTEFGRVSENYRDRLYLNNGLGQLEKTEKWLPEVLESTHCIRPFDFDHDGDMDFFIASRNVPDSYPETPKSRLLINENGKMVDAKNASISEVGMITDALWVDVDGDSWEDLILVGEWMPVTLFQNHNGDLRPMQTSFTNKKGIAIKTTGWWNNVASADFDKDGDIDFLLGNQGLNGFMNPSQEKPLYVYKGDFDQNGSPDPILAQYFKTENGPRLLPIHTRDDIVAQLVSLKKRYLTYDAFVQVNFTELLNISNLEEETLQAHTFQSSYLENLGNGSFVLHPLPEICQIAPINDILVDDFDADGHLDALLVGNDFSAETLYGKSDALTGLFLKGDGNLGFMPIPSSDSGFYIPGQSNHLKPFEDKEGRPWVIATQNNEEVRVFSWK
ncbi:VCBS repeat-containing protein [Ulvibacterium sp.]|uniref:VCBS repeat-containing protein n=1 Tax=Ulvibacterium sp. TaxID=2665914 RepID=UPI00261AF83E|nr:VCBS repeat-containing protein [Ulvibacterium sp.]